MSDLAEFQRRFPWIKWEEPTHIIAGVDSGWFCRICVAKNGLRGSDVGALARTEGEVREHIRKDHGES